MKPLIEKMLQEVDYKYKKVEELNQTLMLGHAQMTIDIEALHKAVFLAHEPETSTSWQSQGKYKLIDTRNSVFYKFIRDAQELKTFVSRAEEQYK